MEIIITAFQTGGIIGAIVIIANIMELLLANDLDYIFFSKSKQKIGSILNFIILFLANTGLIFLMVGILQNNLQINKAVRNFFNIIITFIIFLIIGIELFCKIKLKNKIAKNVTMLIQDNINVLLYSTIIGVDICSVFLILYGVSQNDLVDNSFDLILLAAGTYSFILIFLTGLLKNIKFYNGKVAKFYLSENDEKYYIYYTKGKFLVCGIDINCDESDKYKLIKIDEINNYEIFREKG